MYDLFYYYIEYNIINLWNIFNLKKLKKQIMILTHFFIIIHFTWLSDALNILPDIIYPVLNETFQLSF